MTKPSFCYKMNTLLLGEWLNGRVAVSKTVGCVFESRLPCQIVYRVFRYTIFLRNLFLTRNRLRLTLLFALFRSQTTLFRRCAPYESRLPCQIVYCGCETRFFCTELLLSPRERSHTQRLRLTRFARSGRNRCSVASLLTNHNLPCQIVYCGCDTRFFCTSHRQMRHAANRFFPLAISRVPPQ